MFLFGRPSGDPIVPGVISGNTGRLNKNQKKPRDDGGGGGDNQNS